MRCRCRCRVGDGAGAGVVGVVVVVGAVVVVVVEVARLSGRSHLPSAQTFEHADKPMVSLLYKLYKVKNTLPYLDLPLPFYQGLMPLPVVLHHSTND